MLLPAVVEALAALLMLAGGLLWIASGRRRRHYAHLAGLADLASARQPFDLSAIGSHAGADFSRLVVRKPDVLPVEVLEAAVREANSLSQAERSYIPTHKKGGTIAYETLIERGSPLVALYRSREMAALVSGIVGERVVPTPLHDQSSLSVLIYDRPGDHIGWHYDHNFYRGRHFTVLLALVNTGRGAKGLSHGRLIAKIDGEEVELETSPNTLVVFEGAKVLHRATPIEEGERRIILSMTFCSDPRNTAVQGVTRRVKDMAFFGVRALWT